MSVSESVLEIDRMIYFEPLDESIGGKKYIVADRSFDFLDAFVVGAKARSVCNDCPILDSCKPRIGSALSSKVTDKVFISGLRAGDDKCLLTKNPLPYKFSDMLSLG